MVMNPELMKRFIDSIDYLRGTGFFQDYPNLSSEEILKKIFAGDIDYSILWVDEEKSEEEFRDKVKERRREGDTWGQRLDESLKKHEDYWMKTSDFQVDLELAFFDRKRIFEDYETMSPTERMGISLSSPESQEGFFNLLISGRR